MIHAISSCSQTYRPHTVMDRDRLYDHGHRRFSILLSSLKRYQHLFQRQAAWPRSPQSLGQLKITCLPRTPYPSLTPDSDSAAPKNPVLITAANGAEKGKWPDRANQISSQKFPSQLELAGKLLPSSCRGSGEIDLGLVVIT